MRTRTQDVTHAADQHAYRLDSIDAVRGLVIVIMALDHVRDFFLIAAEPDPMANPNITLGLFATRWITHFCAPVFVLLAGTSAGLMSARKSKSELARFLLSRGIWLIVVECLVISTALTFAPSGMAQLGGQTLVILQVIWVIGASMVVLSGAQLMGRRACFATGMVIVLCHNLLDAFWPEGNQLNQTLPLWVSLHAPMSWSLGPFMFSVSYPLLPWVGVMLLGFGLAGVFELPATRRNAVLLRSGIIATALFIAVRALDIYGDPNTWQPQEGGLTRTVIDFLNTTKYPPSLSFLLMTLGPAAIVCVLADRVTGPIKEAFVTLGRVPFAFYVSHFFLIHTSSVVLGVIQGFKASQFLTLFVFYPEGYGVSLPAVYAIWMVVVVALYPFCRYVAAVKTRRRDWWLSYL